jgi:hypothetical protein
MRHAIHHASESIFQPDLSEYMLEVPKRRPRFDWFLFAIVVGTLPALAALAVSSLLAGPSARRPDAASVIRSHSPSGPSPLLVVCLAPALERLSPSPPHSLFLPPLLLGTASG